MTDHYKAATGGARDRGRSGLAGEAREVRKRLVAAGA